MDPNITIRMALRDDLEALERVGDKLFDYNIKQHRAIEFFNDPRHHLVIALYDDQIVGIASGFHYVHPDKDPAMFVNEVGVLEAFQSKGIGRQMVKSMVDHAREIGCTEAWVSTENSNIAARKAYLAAGGFNDEVPIVLFTFKFNK